MALLYGAFRVRDRPRVLRAQRRPAPRAESRQRRRELREMEAIVRHPRGEQIEARERSEPRVADGVPQPLGGEAGEEYQSHRATLTERGERRHRIRVAIASLLRPARRIDDDERVAALHDHAHARAEVLGLLVAKMANDLERRPFRRGRALAPCGGIETAEENVEDERRPPGVAPNTRHMHRPS